MTKFLFKAVCTLSCSVKVGCLPHMHREEGINGHSLLAAMLPSLYTGVSALNKLSLDLGPALFPEEERILMLSRRKGQRE